MEQNLQNNNNDEKIKNLEKENITLDDKIKELQKEIKDLTQKNKNLTQEKENLKNKNQTLEKDNKKMTASIMKSTIQMENLKNDPLKKSNMFESQIFPNDNTQTQFGNNDSISPFDSNLKGSIMPLGFNGIPEVNEEYASNSNSIKASTNNNIQEEMEFGMSYMGDESDQPKNENEQPKEEITLKDDRKKSLKKSSVLKQSFNNNLFEFPSRFNDN